MRDISDVNPNFVSSVFVLDDVESVVEIFRSFGIDSEDSVGSKVSSNIGLCFACESILSGQRQRTDTEAKRTCTHVQGLTKEWEGGIWQHFPKSPRR